MKITHLSRDTTLCASPRISLHNAGALKLQDEVMYSDAVCLISVGKKQAVVILESKQFIFASSGSVFNSCVLIPTFYGLICCKAKCKLNALSSKGFSSLYFRITVKFNYIAKT